MVSIQRFLFKGSALHRNISQCGVSNSNGQKARKISMCRVFLSFQAELSSGVIACMWVELTGGVSRISFIKYLFIEDSVLPHETLLAVVLNAICRFLVSGLFLISHASEGGDSAGAGSALFTCG